MLSLSLNIYTAVCSELGRSPPNLYIFDRSNPSIYIQPLLRAIYVRSMFEMFSRFCLQNPPCSCQRFSHNRSFVYSNSKTMPNKFPFCGKLCEVSRMSHHRKIYIEIDGTMVLLGHVRITNDDEVLSIWIDHMMKLYHPEYTEDEL